MQSEPIVCKNCTKTYASYTTFRRHIEYGRCKGINVDNKKNTNINSHGQIACPKCNRVFHNIYNLNRHSKSACKSKRVKDLLNDPEGQTMMERLFEIMLKNSSGNTTNNNHGTINNNIENNNSTNNTLNQNNNLTLHQNINIHPLGQENLSHITDDRKIAILKKGLGAVGELYEAILELPENWNVAVTDKRNKKVTYKNRDGKIEIANLEKVLGMITTDNIDRIDEYLDELYDELPLNDKTLQRLIAAQEFTKEGREALTIILHDLLDFEAYHSRCMDRINDILNLKKKKITASMNKYISCM
jgi:hypothetical protein